MSSHQLKITAAAFFFSLALAAPATSEMLVNYLGDLTSYPIIDHISDYDNIYGNLGQPGGEVVPYEGHELGTATTFDPLAVNDLCSTGFIVEVLHMVVVKTDSVSVMINPNLGIGDAFLRDTYPPEEFCFHPTPCPTNSYNYNRYCYAEGAATLVDPGYYEIIFSGDFYDHDCISSQYTHTITTWLNELGGDNLKFVTDSNLSHCPDHYATSYFWGVCHWHEFDAPGNILFWAEVSCCSTPVTTESLNFGTLKSFYR